MSQPNQFPPLNRDQLPEKARLAAFVDVETTGLSPQGDHILEFAGVLFAYHAESGQVLGVVDQFACLNDPGVPIPRAVTRINGIHKRMVKGHRLDVTRIDQLLSPAGFVVAHNAPFDYGFLSKYSAVARDKPWRCSMRQVSWKTEGYSKTALQSLLAEHLIFPKAAHRAEDDVFCGLQLLDCKSENDGFPYFRQLLDSRPCNLNYSPRPTRLGSTQQRRASRIPVKRDISLGRGLLWGCVILPLGGFVLLLFLLALVAH